jgi:hypothetical protein
MFELASPLRALAVGLAGVGLAWLWYNGQPVLALGVAVVAAGLGLVLDALGRALLPRSPVVAVRFLEWWILTPAALAALASGVVVFVTVALAVPEDSELGSDAKELISTLTTGVTAFITAAFISWAGDDADSKSADHIKSVFHEKYKREGTTTPGGGVELFPADSPGERWVYSHEYGGIEGWGKAARLRRAKGVADALAARRGVAASANPRR